MKMEIKRISAASLGKQVRHGVASALNHTAFAARGELATSVGKHFTERSTWTRRGFRVVKASKNKLIAEVGSVRTYMEDQSVGAVRTTAAIPTRAVRRSPKTLIRKRRFPEGYRGPRTFMARPGTKGPLARRLHGRRRVLFRRGPGKRRRPIPLYLLPQSQRIVPRFPFERIALDVVEREFSAAVPGAIRHAFETAKW